MWDFRALRLCVERTYGERNRQIGVERLLESIDASVSRLTKALRKNSLQYEQAEAEIARIVSRVFALERLLEVDVLVHLRKKYPGFCSYCGYRHCHCGEGCQKGPCLPALPELNSPIRHTQVMLAEIYGFKNAQIGCQGVLIHAFEEIAEVRRAILRNPEGREEELTDVFAQTFGFASLVRIDVERAVSSRYANGCPECHQLVCKCPLEA